MNKIIILAVLAVAALAVFGKLGFVSALKDKVLGGQIIRPEGVIPKNV